MKTSGKQKKEDVKLKLVADGNRLVISKMPSADFLEIFFDGHVHGAKSSHAAFRFEKIDHSFAVWASRGRVQLGQGETDKSWYVSKSLRIITSLLNVTLRND